MFFWLVKVMEELGPQLKKPIIQRLNERNKLTVCGDVTHRKVVNMGHIANGGENDKTSQDTSG